MLLATFTSNREGRMDTHNKIRSIQDNVHGLIRLTQEEMDVINHPLFQRLRRICQTGLLRYVWQTATHTRFEHSIGVMYMAQMMLNALSHGSSSGANKLYALEDANSGQAVRFHELDQETRAELKRLVRLTALVHDLGHGPLSHAFDAFAPKIGDLEKLFDDPRMRPLKPFRSKILDGKNGRVRHEAVSCILFALLWHDLGGEPWVPQAVAAVLLEHLSVRRGIPKGLRPWLPFVRDIVSSAPIDADRMDYLLRDSRAIGVSYGLYDVDRVLKSILCVRVACGYRLGWRLSGLRAIENFVTSRFNMFAQVYTHKTLRATELMLDAIKMEAGEDTLIDTESLDRFADGYRTLSDERFLEHLSRTWRPNNRVSELAINLVNRQLWKRLYDFERDEPFVERLTEEMQNLYPGVQFIVDRLPLKAMKDLDRGSFLMRLDRNGKYAMTDKNRSWIEASPIMRVLRDEESARVRLFTETFGDTHGRTKRMRERAIALACELRESNLPPE